MGKRNKGEGTVFRRGSDGRWVARLVIGYRADGKPHYWEDYFATAAEAQEALLRVRSDHSKGLPVVLKRGTLSLFLDRWLEESVKPSVRPKTFEQYHQHARLYLKPSLGRHDLAKLLPQHIQTFINERLKSGLSPRTVQLSLVILRHALDQAMKWDLIARNVAKLVKGPKVRKPELTWLEPEEARKFLDAACGERFEALYSVALSMGLREGEALALR